MNTYTVIALIVGILFENATCDIYLHNPRGSNNRHNENRRNRNNANRMFNSQNNDRGGYNIGSLYYYVGSNLQVEWTNQHSCGGPNNHCDIILQYMCGNHVRDGTSTSTIPLNPAKCENLDCNEDRRYGMHEDFFHYAHCHLRSRNNGLYTADQNLRTTATSTRQNRNGNRYGYECPEERDYFPYWAPSPWKDIAVLTNDVSRCQLYLNESQNVKGKFACDVGREYLFQNVRQRNPRIQIPITQEECENFSIRGRRINATWRFYPAHGIPAPVCAESQPSRDNHLGNGLGGQTLSYNWTIPNDVDEHCTLRIRYNISTLDYHRDETDSRSNNGDTNPGVDVWTRHGLSEEEGDERGYRLENDPEIKVFDTDKLKLQLALDTAQYGRTFQDRSHRFAIRERPTGMDCVIHNVNVRGKRGNIVQVYPAVEYDFVPNTVLAQVDSCVHFQWTGSDNNPGNNDGQGRARTDRSNVVMLKEPVYVEGNPEIYKASTYGQLGSSYPAHLSTAQLGGLTNDDLTDLAILRPQLGGDMVELDDAGTYYDHGLRKVTMTGTYNYMCTRNNNFSNRSQKGTLIVINSAYAQARMDATGGSFGLADPVSGTSSVVNVPPAALSSGTSLELWEISPNDVDVTTRPSNTDYVSSFVYLGPPEKLTGSETQIEVQIKLTGDVSSLHKITIYRSNPETSAWDPLVIDSHENGIVSFHTDRGGHFVVSRSIDGGYVAGLVIGLIVIVVLLIGIIVVLKKNSLLLAGYKNKV